MTPDNRALREMVEMWRERYAKELKKTIRHPFDAVEYKICADELAAILERPVVVSDEDVDAAAKIIADHIGHGMREKCYDVARAALESMVRGKS